MNYLIKNVVLELRSLDRIELAETIDHIHKVIFNEHYPFEWIKNEVNILSKILKVYKGDKCLSDELLKQIEEIINYFESIVMARILNGET